MYNIFDSETGKKIEYSAVIEEKKTKCFSKKSFFSRLLFWFRFEMATAKD